MRSHQPRSTRTEVAEKPVLPRSGDGRWQRADRYQPRPVIPAAEAQRGAEKNRHVPTVDQMMAHVARTAAPTRRATPSRTLLLATAAAPAA